VYWIGLYDILQQKGIRLVLVNARRTKYVPAERAMCRNASGCGRFIPIGWCATRSGCGRRSKASAPCGGLRDRHVQEVACCIQHTQKALTQMNVQLANALSDISGVSGQAFIAGILKGERDLYKLADKKDYRFRASRQECVQSQPERLLFFPWQPNRSIKTIAGEAVLTYMRDQFPERRLAPTADTPPSVTPVNTLRRLYNRSKADS